jgi:SAM-dependent methyltransferase
MWERWGRSDAYYGVISSERFHTRNLPKTKEAFLQTGEHHIAGVLEAMEQRFGALERRSALDFGCGVGRLLLPLSRVFDRVDGVDVSPSMLKEAGVNLSERGINNVELLGSDDRLTSIHDHTYDLVHAHIVFQHIPKRRGYALIDTLLSHVGPKGCFYIYVPIKRMASPIKIAAHSIKHHVPFAYIVFNLLDRKRPLTPTMQMNHYDFGTLLLLFKKHGFETVVSRTDIQNVRTGSSVSVGIFSRRP